MIGANQSGRLSLSSEYAGGAARGVALHGKLVGTPGGAGRQGAMLGPPQPRALSLTGGLDARLAPFSRRAAVAGLAAPAAPWALEQSGLEPAPLALTRAAQTPELSDQAPAPRRAKPSQAQGSLPPALTELLDPTAPGELPAPGSLALGPGCNRELDKLVAGLGRARGTWRRAFQLFDWLRAGGHQPDGRLCTTLIRVAATHGAATEALGIYDWMRGEAGMTCEQQGAGTGSGRAAAIASIRPSVFTYTAMVRAALAGGQPGVGLRVWGHVEADPDCQMDCRLATALLEVCARLGDGRRALALYARMRAEPRGSPMEPSVHAYTAAMRAATEGGAPDAALDIWDDMHVAGCKPTGHAYAAVISACAAEGRWERAVALFDGMLAARIGPDVVSCTALVAALGGAGQPRRAQRVVDWMTGAGVAPNARTWSALLAAHAGAGDWVAALGLLRQLESRESVAPGAGPNAYTYSTLIKTASDQGRVDIAEHVFEGLARRVGAAGHAGAGTAPVLVDPACGRAAAPVPGGFSNDGGVMPGNAGVPFESLPSHRRTPSPTPDVAELRRLLPSQLGAALGGVEEGGDFGLGIGSVKEEDDFGLSIGSVVQEGDFGLSIGSVAQAPRATSPRRRRLASAAAAAWGVAALDGRGAAWSFEKLEPVDAAVVPRQELQENAGGGNKATTGDMLLSHWNVGQTDASYTSRGFSTPTGHPQTRSLVSTQTLDDAQPSSDPSPSHPLLNEVVCGAMMSAYERAGRVDDAVRLLSRAQALGVTPNSVMVNTAMSALARAGRGDFSTLPVDRLDVPAVFAHEPAEGRSLRVQAAALAPVFDSRPATFQGMAVGYVRGNDFPFALGGGALAVDPGAAPGGQMHAALLGAGFARGGAYPPSGPQPHAKMVPPLNLATASALERLCGVGGDLAAAR